MQPLHGIILAAGTGTRLRPLTNTLNKHLLLVHDRPMIYAPIRTLADSGVRNATIVTNAHHIQMMQEVVGPPSDHGFDSINYAAQGKQQGVAAALAAAESFASRSPVFVVLGDNIYSELLREPARTFESIPNGAHIFLKHIQDTSEFAEAQIESGKIAMLTEKPLPPRPGFAVTGAYLYDSTVFERIRAIEPSERSELEITALNQSYLVDKALGYSVLNGNWADAGTPEGLNKASRLLEQMSNHSTE